jgi:hypothetical protein
MYSSVPLSVMFAAFFGAAGNPPVPEEKPFELKAWWEHFGAEAALDSYVGIGTFVKDRHADDPYYGSTLTLTPSYEIIEDLSVSLFFSLSYEWTHIVVPCHAASGPRPEGGPQEDCSDTSDPNGQRWDLLDLVLTVKHSKIVEFGPFSWGASAKFAFPTSRTSRHANNILSLGGKTGIALDLEPFSIGAAFEFYKHFPTAKAPVLDAIEAENLAEGGTPIGRCATFREASCVALQGFVANYNLKADLEAGFDFPWVDGLSTSLSFSYLYARRFGRAPDEFTSLYSNGVNHEDSTIGSWDLSYELADHYTFSLGIFSWQPARTADGKKPRFPFYDFVSPANNYTTWYTTFTASL